MEKFNKMERVSEEILKKITNIIVTAVEPEKIILFGSYARGEARLGSDVDLMIIPGSGHSSSRDRDSALAFLIHIVSRRSAVVDFAHAVHQAGVIQHPLGGRGLTGVNVRDDADVAHFGEV